MPDEYNWCDHIDCGQASDQGLCGSCWAFASIGALEMQLQLEGNTNYVQLSKQHVLDWFVHKISANSLWFDELKHLFDCVCDFIA